MRYALLKWCLERNNDTRAEKFFTALLAVDQGVFSLENYAFGKKKIPAFSNK